jgi:flagellar basal-body rod protein FlgF
MENTSYIALSQQSALQRYMDVIANNLANMNTSGFQRSRMLFAEHLVPNQGGSDESSLAFVRDRGTLLDHRGGRMEQTGNPFDFAIEGDGYFVLAGPDGNRFTRNGRLQVDSSGRLVGAEGLPVVSTGGGEITLKPDDGDIAVAEDGTISTANGAIGRLKIVRFAHPEALEPAGQGLLKSEQLPLEPTDARVEQGMIEGSNVEPISEIEQLIRVSRAYEHARGLIEREDDRVHKMLQVYAA